ncbi:sulfatase [Thalassotalea crassostreae]|uniref:sulfatase n=1 Tax=Thalassotalea crassostreae TaxID=1763536 RepID=UPI0008383384|nr:sulfatase [Thalassotalea crassostreae]
MLIRIFSTVILCLISASSIAQSQSQSQPNIVFILADDLGAHTLSSDGNDIMETPHLDQIAAQGMKFTRGYANAATCKPARAAIMSGQYGPRTSIYRVVDRHKMRGKPDLSNNIKFIVPPNASHLALENVTIAESLKAAGYTTGHFGKWHLEKYKSYLPDTQGFDVSYESHKVHFGAKVNVDQKVLPKDVYIGDYMTDKAIDFMNDAVAKKKPFFTYLPYFLIHKPAEGKSEDIAYFKKKLGADYDDTTIKVAAMTKALDDNVGRVLAKLKDLGIDDNTLVVFTSDNGGYKMLNNVLNGNLRAYKGEIYEGGLRVPYLFRFPGKIKAGQTNSEMVMGIDLYPTLMAFANAKAGQKELDGENLMPLLVGDTNVLAKRDLFWFFPKWERYNSKTNTWHNAWRNVINDGRYKLIQYPDTDHVEVFDLKNDPQESKNIAKNNPEITEQLVKKLEQWKIDISAHKEIPNPNYLVK